jgi:hypothetical protein
MHGNTWYPVSHGQDRTMSELVRFGRQSGSITFTPNVLDDRIEFDSADGEIVGAILPDGTVVYA